MENIYKPKSRNVIQVSKALESFIKELHPLTGTVVSPCDINEVFGYTGDAASFDRLLDSVDVEQHLTNAKDVPVCSFHPSNAQMHMVTTTVPRKATQLLCVQRVLDAQESKAKRNKQVKLRYNRHKYAEKKLYPEPYDLVPYREMLIIIRFYEPFKYKPGRRLGHPRFNQEYHVLSSQYLTELKDKIMCNCDDGPYYEIGTKILQPDEHEKKRPPKSGFFFIHDTFYNDLRDESNHDYSSVIQKWAERQRMIGELKSACMENTRFGDLSFRIGYPQLYQHQGNCEHIFVVSDCRLLTASDILSRSAYPLLNSYGFPRDVPCNICGHSEAQFIVRNSNRIIFDPAYICEICLESYHYKDGEKIGEFELYKFTGTKFTTKHGKTEETTDTHK